MDGTCWKCCKKTIGQFPVKATRTKIYPQPSDVKKLNLVTKVLLFLLLLEKKYFKTDVKIYSPVKGLSIAATINCAQTFIKLATDKSPRELVRFIFRILIFLKLSIWSAFLNPFFFENSPLFKLFAIHYIILKSKIYILHSDFCESLPWKWLKIKMQCEFSRS